jgi:hypothetical protein
VASAAFSAARLPFCFKASDNLFGIHAQLDDFERDAAADRFLLLGHIHHPQPPSPICWSSL